MNPARYFTRKKATSYGLTGWVRNVPNNKVCWHFTRGFMFLISRQVEGEAQGEEDVLQNFLKDIGQGPRHAHVVKLEKSEIEVQEGEAAFEVRH
jgi:acylphosphatase